MRAYATQIEVFLFYSYWQKIPELVALADTTVNGADKTALWNAHAPALGDLFYKIRDGFRKEYLGR